MGPTSSNKSINYFKKNRVQCFVRIRPSSDFAHNSIEILDGDAEGKSKIVQLKSEEEVRDISNLKKLNNSPVELGGLRI